MNTKLKMTDEPPTKEEAFATAIEAAKGHSPALATLLERHPCFAVRWKDESGPCEYSGSCAARVPCHATWREANLLQLAPQPRTLDRPPIRLAALPDRAPPPPPAPAPEKRQRRRKRIKIALAPNRRLVDVALERFLAALGRPSVLPAHWQPGKLEEQHKRRGRMVISRTASFTSVLIDGAMRLRFWTNAAGRALIDMVADLTPAVLAITGAVEEIPEGSKKKSRPCTYRISLVFYDDESFAMLDELAGAVIKTFDLDGDSDD